MVCTLLRLIRLRMRDLANKRSQCIDKHIQTHHKSSQWFATNLALYYPTASRIYPGLGPEKYPIADCIGPVSREVPTNIFR